MVVKQFLSCLLVLSLSPCVVPPAASAATNAPPTVSAAAAPAATNVPPAAGPIVTVRKAASRAARVTSAKTYYDRKAGVAFFDGNVHVDDEQYQLHARRAYVFMDGSNEVRRIVAVGNVALTNDMRRAYGAKVSYYKEGGMVVLYSGDGIVAEVRDESKEQDQVVRGRKIKFWIDTEQVEILEAEISAPTGGMGKGGLKSGFNKIIGK
jgi:lipopolysaccharide transport protein LptA